MFELLLGSAFVAAIGFGFRHGIDWDHIAALTDLTGSQQAPRRSMFLATLYALGHGATVLFLGLSAILFAEKLPPSVDVVMERFVGVTLVALGVYIVWTSIRNRGAPVVRSRWMLLLTALHRVINRRRGGHEQLVVEHSHPHDHEPGLHSHDHSEPDGHDPTAAHARVAVIHSHKHRHVATMPNDPFITYGNWSALGIGMLHGIGAETPTQVLVFAAAANAGGRAASVGLLLCFIAGLLASNTVVAAASTYGFLGLTRRTMFVTTLSWITAVFSLVVGTLFLFGKQATLPVLFGG